ncbi:hypothetical protein [Flavobacterium sp.]|uniref:hypothetical protein n=1 Tax=Flavobacterium sp. TaxID=239 RepID=UPI002614CD33|nr:hypothetical protein [Flavobacterium sp.]
MTNKVCNLCGKNPADKLNSHIIPKFMCKRLFENVAPRHTVLIRRNATTKRIQDVPKENNIFCVSCEKRIEIIETYFSKIFIDINNLPNAKRKYIISTELGNELLIFKDLIPALFKVFLFSLVWRASISELQEFKNFKLDIDTENELRSFLNDNLKTKHSDLIESAKKIIKTPDYHHCVIKPKYKTRGIFAAYEFAEDAFIILTVDYAFIFFSKNTSLTTPYFVISNKNHSDVKILLGQDKDWKILNNLILKKMINSNNN